MTQNEAPLSPEEFDDMFEAYQDGLFRQHMGDHEGAEEGPSQDSVEPDKHQRPAIDSTLALGRSYIRVKGIDLSNVLNTVGRASWFGSAIGVSVLLAAIWPDWGWFMRLVAFSIITFSSVIVAISGLSITKGRQTHYQLRRRLRSTSKRRADLLVLLAYLWSPTVCKRRSNNVPQRR